MKSIVKTLTLGTFAIAMVACSSQKEQPSNQGQRQGGQQEDRQQSGGQQRGVPTFAQLLEEMDANNDGLLAQSEVKGPLQEGFSTIDADGDGFISEAEFNNAPKPSGRPPRN